MLSTTFDNYIDILLIILLEDNDQWICDFSLCRRVLVGSKNLAVFILKNLLKQMLSSRDILPNDCSLDVLKVAKKYLRMNSFLTEMQFFSMHLDFD